MEKERESKREREKIAHSTVLAEMALRGILPSLVTFSTLVSGPGRERKRKKEREREREREKGKERERERDVTLGSGPHHPPPATQRLGRHSSDSDNRLGSPHLDFPASSDPQRTRRDPVSESESASLSPVSESESASLSRIRVRVTLRAPVTRRRGGATGRRPGRSPRPAPPIRVTAPPSLMPRMPSESLPCPPPLRAGSSMADSVHRKRRLGGNGGARKGADTQAACCESSQGQGWEGKFSCNPSRLSESFRVIYLINLSESSIRVVYPSHTESSIRVIYSESLRVERPVRLARRPSRGGGRRLRRRGRRGGGGGGLGCGAG